MIINYIKDENLRKNEIEVRSNEKTYEVEKLLSLFTNSQLNIITLYLGFDVYKKEVSSITKFYIENSEVYALIGNQSYKVKHPLYFLADLYKSQGFLKINNHEVINIEHIDHFDLSKSGSIFIVLDNNCKSKISRRRVKEIKNYLGI